MPYLIVLFLYVFRLYIKQQARTVSLLFFSKNNLLL